MESMIIARDYQGQRALTILNRQNAFVNVMCFLLYEEESLDDLLSIGIRLEFPGYFRSLPTYVL